MNLGGDEFMICPHCEGDGKIRIEHGTHRGYNQHRRRGEIPCRECKDAYNRYRSEWAMARRGVWGQGGGRA
jgi:hypothetical protein